MKRFRLLFRFWMTPMLPLRTWKSGRRQVDFLLAIVLLGAFALRVSRLDGQSLWWDEVFTVLVTRMPFPYWFNYIFWDDRAQTPGYFALMSFWSQLGDNEFVVRYVSALGGTLSIPLIYLVARRVGGREVGILAALLLALSPFHLWYSQEARVYALQASFALLSTYLFLRLLEEPRWRETLALTLTNAVGLYCHYLFAMVIFAQIVVVILLRTQRPAALKRGLAASALSAVIFSPWLIAILVTGGFATAGIDWVPPAQWYDPVLTFYVFLLGSTNYPRDLANWLTPIIMVSFMAYGLWAVRKDEKRDAVMYLLLCLIAPVGMIFLLSLPVTEAQRSIYVDRYMVAELPPLIVLIALGARRLFAAHPRLTASGLGLAMIPILFSVWNMYSDPTLARVDWRGIGAYVATHADRSRDQVALEASATFAYLHYDTARLDQIAFSVPIDSGMQSKVDQLVQSGKPTRLWLFTETIPRDVHGLQPTVDERLAAARRDSIKRLLDKQFPTESEILFQGVLVTLYRVVP